MFPNLLLEDQRLASADFLHNYVLLPMENIYYIFISIISIFILIIFYLLIFKIIGGYYVSQIKLKLENDQDASSFCYHLFNFFT